MKSIRNLGIAALLVAALTATFGVSAASASEFAPGSYPAEIEGTAESQLLLFDSAQFSCDEPSPFTSSVVEAPGVGGDSLRTFTPDYTCYAPSRRFKMELGSRGCGFIFHPGEEIAAGKWQGKFDLGDAPGRFCSDGAIFNQEYAPACKYKIAPFVNMSGVTFEAQAGEPDTVRVNIDEVSLPITVEGPGSCWHSMRVQHASWVLNAYELWPGEERGNQLDLTVSDQYSEEWEGDTTPHGGFEAEQYPATVAGTQTATPHVLTTNSGPKVSCTSSTFDIPGGLQGPSQEIATHPTYSGCTTKVGANTLPTAIDAGTCGYDFATGTPASAGTMSVGCTKAGDKIEIKVYANATKKAEGQTLCVYHLGEQGARSGAGLSMVNPGTSSGVRLNIGVEGLAISRTGSILCGSPTTATYAGELTLQGTNEAKESVGLRVT